MLGRWIWTTVSLCALGCASQGSAPCTASAPPTPGTARPDARVVLSLAADGTLSTSSGQQGDVATLVSAIPSDELAASPLALVVDPGAPQDQVLGVVDRLLAAGARRVEVTVMGPPPAPVASATTDAPPSAPSAAPSAAPPSPPPADAGEPPGPSLPEVLVENVGLHIGGGPNDDAAKAPFEKAIAPHFDEFRSCYVHVVEPEKGGTFGVDMLIKRAGGHPEVKQPRTGMKGSEFRDCMVKAFQNIEFEKPQRGPTMISYSVRFKLSK
ncbi:MAG: hypothetical protein KC776_41770 [Myxococcales bacterium]|nr:hypothetical protein [Myxococcales bacterium]